MAIPIYSDIEIFGHVQCGDAKISELTVQQDTNLEGVLYAKDEINFRSLYSSELNIQTDTSTQKTYFQLVNNDLNNPFIKGDVNSLSIHVSLLPDRDDSTNYSVELTIDNPLRLNYTIANIHCDLLKAADNDREGNNIVETASKTFSSAQKLNHVTLLASTNEFFEDVVDKILTITGIVTIQDMPCLYNIRPEPAIALNTIGGNVYGPIVLKARESTQYTHTFEVQELPAYTTQLTIIPTRTPKNISHIVIDGDTISCDSSIIYSGDHYQIILGGLPAYTTKKYVYIWYEVYDEQVQISANAIVYISERNRVYTKTWVDLLKS